MNHKAIIAEITQVIEIPNADSIHVARVLGENVIVSKEWGVGTIGVLFPVDVQLSEEFCHHNNLFRDSQKNSDNTKKGFFDENRRVRAQSFLKVKSEGFFAGLDSLTYTGHSQYFKDGDSFDELNGHKLCCKYISEAAKISKGNNNVKAAKKEYAPFFAKHVDSEQFKHNIHKINNGDLIHVHSKRHGTSFRVGYTSTGIDLPRWKKVVNKYIDIFPSSKYDYVVGTRNVVLKPVDKDKDGYHGSEAFRFEVMEVIKPHLTPNMLVFGEIIGFVNGKPIMPPHSIRDLKDKKMLAKYGDSVNYSYGCKDHEFKFFVYRIAYVQPDNTLIDMSQAQLEQWCDSRNIQRTLELCEPFVYNGNEGELTELVVSLAERAEHLCADPTDDSHLHEGVIVRVEGGGLVPTFLKYKTFNFKVCEGHLTVSDIEEVS